MTYCNRLCSTIHLSKVPEFPPVPAQRLFCRLKLFLLVEGHITSSLDALSRRLGMAVCAADMRALRPQGIRFALVGEQWHVWMTEVQG